MQMILMLVLLYCDGALPANKDKAGKKGRVGGETVGVVSGNILGRGSLEARYPTQGSGCHNQVNKTQDEEDMPIVPHRQDGSGERDGGNQKKTPCP